MAAAPVFFAGEAASALSAVTKDQMGMRLAVLCAGMAALNGCRTPANLPAVDLAQPGWQVRQGQAVWTTGVSGPELAGELLWATHPDGRFVLQFLKTPITMVEAQGS